jgi:hypothetical protein
MRQQLINAESVFEIQPRVETTLGTNVIGQTTLKALAKVASQVANAFSVSPSFWFQTQG